MGKMISEHPYMFAAFVVVLLAAIAGVIYGVVTKGGWKDRGQIVREGKPLYWARNLLPIPVYALPSTKEQYVASWNLAAAKIAEVVGRPVFKPIQRVQAHFQPDSAMHAIVLSGDAGTNPNKGDANIWWDRLSGEIIRASVVFPDDRAETRDAYPIALHEALHTLGLDHDEGVYSIMHPQLQEGDQIVTERDQTLLRELYKEGE